MEIAFFFRGLLIGFVVAVPVGPLGLFCINRALSGGAFYGLASGLGIATADALSAAVAVLGLSLVVGFLIHEQVWLRLIAGLVLCYLGFRIFTSKPEAQIAAARDGGFLRAYASMFLLAITHPGTLLSLLAICAGWGVGDLSANYLSAGLLTSGVFFGSALWWFLLASSLLLFGSQLAGSWLRGVQRTSGVVIMGFAVIILLSLL